MVLCIHILQAVKVYAILSHVYGNNNKQTPLEYKKHVVNTSIIRNHTAWKLDCLEG